MKLLTSRRGFVTHPIMMFVIAFILGLALAYLWINYTNIANPFCAR